MTLDILVIIGSTSLSIGLSLIFYFLIFRWLKKQASEAISSKWSNLMQVIADKQIEEATKQIIGFLLTPKVFLYLDKVVIDSLYSQISSPEKTIGIERETVKETSKSVSPDLQVVKGEYVKKNGEREKKQIQIIETPESKHDEVLGNIASHLQLALNLETFSYNTKPDEAFIKGCAELEQKTGYTFPAELKEEYSKINKIKQCEEKILEIESSKGKFVLMQIDATVSENPEKKNMFYLDFLHPLNSYLNFENEPRVKFTIHIQLPPVPNNLTEIGVDTLANSKKVSIKIFGKLIAVDRSTGQIIIRPISIY